jgi:hypothetical protein
MQKSSLQFESEEDLKKFLKEAQEKKDDEAGNQPEEWKPDDYKKSDPRPYDYRDERKGGGMNEKYHSYRMLIFLVAGLILIAFGDKLLTAVGVGLVALAIILHQATMSLVIREELK